MSANRKISILLIEDNPGDVRLTQEAFNETNLDAELIVVGDGEQATDFLFNKGQYGNVSKPDLILLDLNLPRKNGIQVLEEIKFNDETRTIPVIVLTTSDAEHDIQQCYQMQANAYILKPVDFLEYTAIIKLIDDFWFNLVKLPSR